MSNKENDRFSDLASELRAELNREADLLVGLYNWFIVVSKNNKEAAGKIHPKYLGRIWELTIEDAADIEDQTGVKGLSDLVSEYENIKNRINKCRGELAELWPQIIESVA